VKLTMFVECDNCGKRVKCERSGGKGVEQLPERVLYYEVPERSSGLFEVAIEKPRGWIMDDGRSPLFFCSKTCRRKYEAKELREHIAHLNASLAALEGEA